MSKKNTHPTSTFASGFMIAIVSVSTAAGIYETSAKTEKIVICHVKTKTPETREINANALAGHMDHGDYLGPCQSSSSSSSSSSSQSSSRSSSSSSSDVSSSSSMSSSDSSSQSSALSSSESSSSVSSSASSDGSAGSSSSVSMSSSENSSIPSSDSSSTSTSSSSAAGSSTIDDSAANLLPAAPSDGGGAGAGDGIAENGDIIIPIYRGAGLAEHASVLDFILTLYGIQQHPTYTHSLEHDSLQSGFASDDSGASEILRKLAASCSMYRYFQRLHDMQPNVPQADIDMITSLFGKAIGQNPEQMKAALSGQPFGQTNADGFTQSITDAGCAANPYVYMPTTDAQGNGVNEVPPSQNFTNPLLTPEHPLSLHIEDRSTDTELAFAIVNDQGETFRDYGYSHGEEMHLIIWRNDLQHFYHIHPQHDALGLWRLPFTPDAGGSYWIYTNFVDQHGNAYAFPLSRTYAGDTGPIGIVPDAGMVKIIGGYQVELMPAKTPQGMSFAFKITDAKGQAVHLQKFLGAKGHLFMISTSGYFLHTHPATDANNLVFYTAALPVGFYRVTVQFQVDKEVETLSFDWAQ